MEIILIDDNFTVNYCTLSKEDLSYIENPVIMTLKTFEKLVKEQK